MCILSLSIAQCEDPRALHLKSNSVRNDTKEEIKYFPLPEAEGSSGTKPEGICMLAYRFVF